MSVQVVEGDCEDMRYREFTEAERDRVVFRGPVLKLRGMDSDRVHEHSAPDGAKRQTRPETRWCGGIDVHHVYFSGLACEKGGVWSIGWDS